MIMKNRVSKKLVEHIIECVLEECTIECNCLLIPEKIRKRLVMDLISKIEYNEDDICDSCYSLLEEDDFKSTFESRMGNGCNESVITGYTCHVCSHKEEY